MPEDLPTYPHHKQIVRYFNDYAKHFGVSEKIKFNRQVVDVSLEGKDQWRVQSAPSTGVPLYLQEQPPVPDEDELFDAIMVCNGHHSVPVSISDPLLYLESSM